MKTRRRWNPKKSAWAAEQAAEMRRLASACTYDPLRHDPATAGPVMRKLRAGYLMNAIRYEDLAERFRAEGN